jgi:protein SCO1/2
MNRSNFPIGSLLLFGLFVLVMLATWLLVKPPPAPRELEGILRSQFRPIAPFRLTDHHRQRFDEKNLRGKWSLIFFGYLSCPDVCPMTLHELNLFWHLLQDDSGAKPQNLQVLFVSVDPERDSQEFLADYINQFNRDFIAATAAKAQIDNLVKQFGAGYIIEAETAPGQYQVAHSSAIFLVDPLGRSVATFSQPHYAATLLAQYRMLTRYFGVSGQLKSTAGSVPVARAGLFPLLESPDQIGRDQHQVDHDPDGKKTDRRRVPSRGLHHAGGFILAALNSAHGH